MRQGDYVLVKHGEFKGTIGRINEILAAPVGDGYRFFVDGTEGFLFREQLEVQDEDVWKPEVEKQTETVAGSLELPPLDTESVGGAKFDTGKVTFKHLPVEFLVGVCRVFMFGAEKYKGKGENYRNGIQYTRLLDAGLRHLLLEYFSCGVDSDSKKPHWAGVGASMAMYAFMKSHFPELDDRPKLPPEQVEKIIEMLYDWKDGHDY